MFTVKYKRINGFFTKEIKNVVGDQFNEEARTRVFYLEDNTIVEVPVDGVVFEFSKERFDMIHQKMESQAGTRIPLSGGHAHAY